VVVIVLLLLDSLLTPTIRTLSELECRSLASSAVNSSLLETLEREQMRYDDLTVLRTNDEGLVTSVSADIVQLNKLKAAVGAAIDEKLGGLRYRTLALPLFNVLGFDYFMGRGPVIQVHMKFHGESFSVFVSEFDSVGVNQTRHRIFLRVETKVYQYWNRNSDVLSFETQVCAAETVIVGAVPNIRWNYDTSSPLTEQN